MPVPGFDTAKKPMMTSCSSLWNWAMALSFVALLGACSDSSTGKSTANADAGIKLGLKPGQLSSFKGIETKLSTNTTTAGVDVTVACFGEPGDVAIPTPTYTVAPAADVVEKGTIITAHKSGTYDVTCTVPGLSDTTPEKLTVYAGPATTISTQVDPAQIAAGDSAKAKCTGTDAFGNDASFNKDAKWSVKIDPPTTATISDLDLKGNKVGKGTVTCLLSGSESASTTTATLTVVAGKPAKTVAKVDPTTFEAGAGSATVSCSAVDAQGNDVGADPAQFTLDIPTGLTLQGTSVSTTKSGSYDIGCNLSGVSAADKATLTVTPGKPISMTLVAKPNQPVYAPDDKVQLSGLGKDQYGNDVPGMPVGEATIDPPGEVTVVAGGKSYWFQHDGIFKFTAASVDYPSLSASLTVKVDSTGPLVLITDPQRAQTRQGDPKVTVKGSCIDELSAVKGLTINKLPVTIGADGSFTFDIDSQQGMNAIIWEAVDEWGNKSNGVQTYYYSTLWYPADNANPVNSMVKSGIGVWMAQSTLDAGPPHDHKSPKDLASVAEVVIGSIDIKSLLGNAAIPVNQGLLGLNIDSIEIKNFKIGDPANNGGYPDVTLKVIKGGMHLMAKIYKMDLTVRVNVSALGLKGYMDAEVTADWIQIDTDILISLDPVTGKPISSAQNTALKISTMKIQMVGNSAPFGLDKLLDGAINGIIGFLDTFLNGVFTGLLESILQSQIQSMIGNTMGSVLGALAINTELPLKPFIGTGPEVKLKLSSKLGLLNFQEAGVQQGGMLIGLDAAMTAPPNVNHQVLGSIGRAACLTQGQKDIFNPLMKFALEIGLADDFVNELLFAVWQGGLLNLSIGADALGQNADQLTQFGVADLNLTTDFYLPPIINTCLDNQYLKLQIGDMNLHAKLTFSGTPVDVIMFATMQATAQVMAVDVTGTTDKNLAFSLKSVDFVELEVVSINAEAKGLKDLFVTLIKGVMIPKLVDSLGSGLGSFPLPSFDLSAFSPSIPPGTSLGIQIQQIDNSKGYTYLRGKVK